jgi:hypothetical protein
MDMRDLAFPKPGDIKEPAPAVRIYDGGREVCNMMTAAGKREYRRRTLEMRERQDNRCCLCHQWMSVQDTTFEHEAGRGMNGAHRDDRIEKDGKWLNGAAHFWCNSLKGSQRGNYNSQSTQHRGGSSGPTSDDLQNSIPA